MIGMDGPQYGIWSPRVEINKTFIFAVFYINFGNDLEKVIFKIQFQTSLNLFFLGQTRWISLRFALLTAIMVAPLLMFKYGFGENVGKYVMKVEKSEIQKLSKQVRGPPR